MIVQEWVVVVIIWPFADKESLPHGFVSAEHIWIVTDPDLPGFGEVDVRFALNTITRERWKRFQAAMEEAFKIAEKAVNGGS